jgi:hypothetical protein
MSRLRLVVPGYIKEPEPALVQHEYLWGERQDAALSQATARKIRKVTYFIDLTGLGKITINSRVCPRKQHRSQMHG